MLRWVVVVFAFLVGCTPRHRAPIAAPELPPLPSRVAHSGKLWIELRGLTDDEQCARPEGHRRLCFDGVQTALARALGETAWTSFPAIAQKQRGDNLEPGDYLLLVWLKLDPLPPDARFAGWSAAAHAKWQLARDGLPVESGSVSSRSRGDFAYGKPLGVAGGEVIAAVAAQIAAELGSLPERRRPPEVPLPPVVAVGEP